MQIGELDTDSKALAARLAKQDEASAVNLNDWIFEQLRPVAGDICLDLGCGTGNQSIPLARTVGPSGSVTSVDLSEESLGVLRKAAEADGTSERVSTYHSGLDEFGETIAPKPFTLVVGSYCLYYVNDMVKMFTNIRDLMADSGRLLFCGPGRANNLALIEMTTAAGGKNGLGRRPAVEFMEDEAQAVCRDLFGADKVQVRRVDNPVTYRNADDLIEYWTNHNLHEAAVADAFAERARAHFAENEIFVNKKSIVGVLVAK